MPKAKKQDADMNQEMASLLHQQIWETLPKEREAELKEKIEEAAQTRGIPLSNPIAPAEDQADNQVMMQYFEWFLPNDGQHWNKLKEDAQHLKSLGVGGVWMPPFCKGTGDNDVGYGIYDLYDLGEFDQKGTVRTKYGTKKELTAAISALHRQGIQAYGDVVLNHKAGADETEVFKAVRVNPENRLEEIGEPYDIEGWTRFTFPGRKGKYSPFTWNFEHFNGVSFDNRMGESGIFRILGENKDFSDNVSSEYGNFDYLMFANIDYRHQEVIDETLKWGQWVVTELGLDGMRMDAVKHIDANFMEVFVRHVRMTADKPLYFVAEYWDGNDDKLSAYIQRMEGLLALFDVSLHFHFVKAAEQGQDYDLRRIFEDTLISRHVMNCVTFVDNHDSQPGQGLASWVQDWFKPLAHALILLRKDGYPCVFYGDYYGINGDNPIPAKREVLDMLLSARLKHAYGEQVDYFDNPNTIGWVRLGDEAHENSGLACVITNGDGSAKRMCLGDLNAGTAWRDITGSFSEPILLDEGSWADFPCKGRYLSVWVKV
ncbi:MAG: alpha-amylase [Eubacteriales bacterium]|nr:alpha-amylase [Eubacteriales bacterium]